MRINNLSHQPPSVLIKENLYEIEVIILCSKNLEGIIEHNEENKKGINNKWENDEIYFSDIESLLDYLTNDYGKNDKKSMQSINRAKTTISDLISSNAWDYFGTLTIEEKNAAELGINPKDVNEVAQYLMKFINNQNRKQGNKIKYVIIPEYQKNGNVHFHGVFNGIRQKDLVKALNNQEFKKDKDGSYKLDDNGNLIPNELYLKPLKRKGNQVFNYEPYKLGFTDFEQIRNRERVGKYCTKYLHKELLKRCEEFGAHLYYCSQGLERPKVLYKKEIEAFNKYDKETILKEFPNAYVSDNNYSQRIVIKKGENDIQSIIDKLSNIGITPKENDYNESITQAQTEFIKSKGKKNESVVIGKNKYMYDENTGEIIIQSLGKVKQKHIDDINLLDLALKK